jgi:transposase InsO family protein
VWAYLRYREAYVIGKNRVYRVMKENNLLVTKNLKLRAKRGHLRPKPQAISLNQYWGMDMTKILFPDGWGYLHVVKDWYSKEIVGWSFSMMSRTEDWLDALNQAVNKRFPAGIKHYNQIPELITDNGCQPTSERFMRACAALDIKQIFTSFNNPKGNADTERLMRTLKEDLVWVYEWESAYAFEQAFKVWVDDYNNDFPHMTLGYKTPQQMADETLLIAA